MTMFLLIVTAPKPPGSRQLISPPLAVLEMAPAKVLQRAVRLHGLTSSPTPHTPRRVAGAKAGVAWIAVPPSSAAAYNIVLTVFVVIFIPLGFNGIATLARCNSFVTTLPPDCGCQTAIRAAGRQGATAVRAK